jgi:hypothetical protein
LAHGPIYDSTIGENTSIWPLDKGKAKVGLRSGSRSTPRSGWSMGCLGSSNESVSSMVLDKEKQCRLMSG